MSYKNPDKLKKEKNKPVKVFKQEDTKNKTKKPSPKRPK